MSDENIDAIQIERREHMKWLKTHREKYAGNYIALMGNQLVGQIKTMAEALEQARRQGANEPFLMRVTPADEILFGGW